MEALGGDPRADQPAGAGRAGDRPLDPGRRVRRAARVPAQRRAASSSATASATRSCAGARRRSTTSPSCRRTPASATRSTSSTSANVVHARDGQAFPDTLVGTDSHTTMVNGLGVLGWGVGGIEAEAAMLGQPVSMLIPEVVGFRLTGELPEGATATDLVLTVTQMLRAAARGRASSSSSTGRGWRTCRWPTARRSATCRRSTARRAGSSRSTPRRCATCEFTGRPAEQVELVEAYCRAQGMFHEPGVAGAGVLRHARARPGDGRAEPGRAAPAAGPRGAQRTRRATSARSCARSSAARPTRAGTRRPT